MKKTIGQTIKELRNLKGITQEELAELISVTPQAISKWEREVGYPDIAQIIPLANIFGVSTDVLFGIEQTDNLKEIQEIVRNAYKLVDNPVTMESARLCYNALLEGLKKYPNNTLLLTECLETAMLLAYPENKITYDKENGKRIYEECIRQANIVIKFSNFATDILRARFIMVLLHSAHGNFQQAKEHADKFPWRSDMTFHKMNAYIAHFENNKNEERKSKQYDFTYHLESILDSMISLGNLYMTLKDYENAYYVYMKAYMFIESICEKEEALPTFVYREYGDIRCCISEACIKLCRYGEAIEWIEKTVNYYMNEFPRFKGTPTGKSPFFDNIKYPLYNNGLYKNKHLYLELTDERFDAIKENEKYKELLKKFSEY